MIATKDGHTCSNKTRVMAYIILGTHCAEVLIALVAILSARIFKNRVATIERFINILANVWVLYQTLPRGMYRYFLTLFVVTQVYLFDSSNDCKDGTASTLF